MFLLNAVILLIFANVSAENTTKIPQVDTVIDNLSNQQWEEDEAICKEKIFNLLNNVKNSTLWATWVWDSNPKAPLGTFFGATSHLGNYDQCLRPPWLAEHPELKTQYCLADVEMSKDPGAKNWDLPGPYARAEEYYVDAGMPTGRSFSFMSYGVCLPAGCQTKSVAKFVKGLLNGQHLQAAWDADVKIHHCEEAGASREVPRGYYVYMYTFAALVFIALFSTYYTSEFAEKVKTNTFVNHVVRSFCLRRNWETVRKVDKDALPCIDGIRFLTSALVVFVHVSVYTSKLSVSNGIDFERILETKDRSLFTHHSDLLVDTFFAIAALLLGKSLSTLDITKPYNLLKYIAKRYIRLIGVYVVVIFYVANVLLQKDSGPLYPKLVTLEQQNCEKNWWVSMLMLGNYVRTDVMCLLGSWYIPCDFQFYVITLIILYIYRKNPKVGTITAAIVAFCGILGPAINYYLYDLPAISTINMGVGKDLREQKNFTKGYIHAHIRMGPYIAGLLVGYLMSVYKPADYKRKWSKTTSFLGVCAGLALMASVLAASVVCYRYRVYGLLACVFKILDRTVYACGVLFIIVSCTYGDVPLVNSFLSWSPFRSLSRFTYGIYLIHASLLYESKMASRSYLRYHGPDILIEAFGVVVKALSLSLVVWLLVEAPLVNLTSKYLDTRSETKESINGIVQNEAAENLTNKPKIL